MRRTTGAVWRWLALSLFLAGILLGCGSPQQRYKVLSFFFDGVPDPNAPAKDTVQLVTAGRSGQTIFIHKPYAQQQCESCHIDMKQIFTSTKIKAGACIQCHEPVLRAYATMHGPVESESCTTCHSSHTSQHQHLLVKASPGLCLDCHETGSFTKKVPEHGDVKADCLSCHSGHGGADRHYLKVTMAAPATQAAASESGVTQ